MEIADGSAKTLADLLHKPECTPLASPGPPNETPEEQHSETGTMKGSPAEIENDPAASSPEMAEMHPLDTIEMPRKSQEAGDAAMGGRGKTPTLSPEYEKAYSESTGTDFGGNLAEFDDGHQSTGIAMADPTSLQRQSHGFDPPAYVQHERFAPLHQKSTRFEGFDDAKSDAFGEHLDPIGGTRTSVHPLEQIERSLPHKLTLQLWQDEERLLRMRIQTHASSCSHIEHEIHQIFGFDFLFQGILVASAAQASVLDCATAWVPLVLSIAASLVAFLAIFRKLETRERFNSQLLLEQSDARVLFDYMERMKSLGELFDLNDLPHSSSVTKRGKKKFPSATDKVLTAIWSYKFFVLLALLVFSILVVVSFQKLLCNS